MSVPSKEASGERAVAGHHLCHRNPMNGIERAAIRLINRSIRTTGTIEIGRAAFLAELRSIPLQRSGARRQAALIL